jgi:AcrR family transcriptional regulator
MADSDPTHSPRRRGRPSDPSLAPRVVEAALRLYGEQGWAGFSFEMIAQRSGVGKNALYRRWPDKGALLREVLEKHWVAVDHIDTGTFAGDLRALCRMLFAHLAGPLGDVGLQLQLDGARHPLVAEAIGSYTDGVQRSARAMVRRAAARGELAPETSTTLVLDLVTGAVASHIRNTPPALREVMCAKAEEWIADLVGLVCRGVKAPT